MKTYRNCQAADVTERPHDGDVKGPLLRPVHLLRVSLLGVLESNFPGDPLSNSTGMRIPTLRIKSLLESNPPKPKLLVGGLGVRSGRNITHQKSQKRKSMGELY